LFVAAATGLSTRFNLDVENTSRTSPRSRGEAALRFNRPDDVRSKQAGAGVLVNGYVCREGIGESQTPSSSSEEISKRDLLLIASFGVGMSTAVGGTKVSGASDGRRPRRLLRRLFSFRLPPAGFVGVGGSSSALD
jgi:hypothetical protein